MALPHTTIEVPGQREPADNYLEYWQHERQQAERLPLLERTQLNSLSRVLGSLAYNGIRDPNLSALVAVNEVVHEKPKDICDAVAIWDKASGSFNHMGEGQADLLRGAGLLLQFNRATKNPREDFNYVPGDPKDTFEAFRELFASNGLEKQKPNGHMLLMGQLIHKAALVEADASRRESLLDMAETVYGAVYTHPGEQLDIRFKAGEHRDDIRMHRISEQLRAAYNASDADEIARLKQGIRLIQQQQLIDLKTMRDIAAASKDIELRHWAGLMAEHLTMICARDRMYLSTNVDYKGKFELRRSFISEDEPYEIGGRKKTSFDFVVQQYDSTNNVISTSPVQLKSRQKGETESDRSRGYVPEIHRIVITGLSVERMRQAGDSLMAMYRQPKVSKRGAVVLNIEESLDPLLKAA